MEKILSYQIIELISKSHNTEIYRAADNHNKVILKLLRDEFIDAERLARFRKEYEVTSRLSSEWIVRPLNLQKYNDTYVMVLEDFGGIPLNQFIAKNSPCIDQKQLIDLLEVAILIIKALNDVHNQDIVHKDINPSNIIYNKEKKLLKIIDFGLATKLKNEHFEPADEPKFEGTYAYISPEQTGRFNRTIDYRTDFYSFGITIYELFAGRLPFSAESPREWIHSHIAKEPVSLNKLNPNIPKKLSDIIMKLISKTAENRYQSGYGIIRDLEICLSNLTTIGKIENFKVGKYDVSQRFQIPQKLYGREKEINQLLAFFKEIDNNESAFLLVNGYSGIGKTSVILEIQRPVVMDNGYFTSGKFDQLKRNIPYNAFLQALTKLIRSLLSESKEEIQKWKNRILENLDGKGKLITNVIPELEIIIGDQPQLPVLSPSESQNRFFNTFKDFINAFTSNEHPLVLFLDDLHWADTASLDMIENLLITHQNGKLLLIGAYRDNEISSEHPLLNFIEIIRKNRIKSKTINIGALDKTAVQELFTDSFSLNSVDTDQLARLCQSKTDGNPFFIHEFLQNLYRNELLYFNIEIGKWILEFDKIEQSDVTENVAEFISNRFNDLSPENQQILKYAACIGSKFSAALLYRITKKPWKELITLLNKSSEESFIYAITGQYHYAEYDDSIFVEYKFVHDRVQQEIYSLITENEKVDIHLQIGKNLIKSIEELNKDDKLYTVLEHLNKGIKFLHEDEKLQMVKLNLQACQRTKKAGAFDHALFFINVCQDLIDESIWSSNYDLALQVNIEQVEALALVGRYAEMDRAINNSLKSVKNIVDKVKLLVIRVQSYISQHQQPEAVNEALRILKLLNVRFPKNPKKLHIIVNYLKISYQLKHIDNIEDIEIPAMTDSQMRVAMNIMATILSASYYVNPNLFPLIVFRLIQFTLKHGIAPKSPVAFITLGLIDWSMNKTEQGYTYGQLGMKMLDKSGTIGQWSQAACIYNSGVAWKEPLKNSIKGLFDAYKAGMDTGDNEFAVASAAAGLCYKFYSGSDIRDLFTEINKYKNSLGHLNQNVPFNQIKGLLQTVHTFIEGSDNVEKLEGTYYKESEMLPHFIEVKDNASALDLYLKKMVLAYCFKKYPEGYEIAKQARTVVKDVAGLFLYALFHFYESLILLAIIPNAERKDHNRFQRRIEKNQKKIKKWSESCPSNYANKYSLIQAGIEENKGNIILAGELYDEAIKLAQEEGNFIEHALSNELAGLFWLKLGKKQFAQIYLSKAYKIYNIWGASAKANTLKNEFSKFIISGEDLIIEQSSKSTRSSTGTSRIRQPIDLETVLEAAKAISSEIIFTDLIKKTLTIILEHAGAQRGVFIFNKGEKELSVEAIGYVEKNNIHVILESKDMNEQILPQSLIRYTERTQESIVLHDANGDNNYIQDEYFIKNNIKSVITIPILYQSKLSGILYLENNLSTNVFDHKKIDILTILCTQAAISIENAILYNSLEQKVKERTKEISNKNILLQNQNEKIELAHNQLAELNATKDKFFSIIAHDLRGPIGTISHFFDVITREELIEGTDNIEIFIEDFKKVSKNTYDLLNNLLVWAQSQRNEVIFNPEFSNLNNLVETNLSLIEHKAQAKEVSLINSINSDAIAYFDVNLIDTVIRNLVNNAVKYTSNGDTITISIENKEQFAIVSVQDTGIGIDDKLISNLFSIENKSESRKGTNGEMGTGLGLTLCKEFVEKNGGNIWVKSEENKGSTFSFSVPLKKF